VKPFQKHFFSMTGVLVGTGRMSTFPNIPKGDCGVIRAGGEGSSIQKPDNNGLLEPLSNSHEYRYWYL
jgi:hypothetical protein